MQFVSKLLVLEQLMPEFIETVGVVYRLPRVCRPETAVAHKARKLQPLGPTASATYEAGRSPANNSLT